MSRSPIARPLARPAIVSGRPPQPSFGKPARPSITAERFDLPGPVPLRRSYLIASTPRSGSTFLCTRLCGTGLLGMPAEYFGFNKQDGRKMMARLAATSTADYLQKLLERRTSENGVFGINMDFGDFEEAVLRLPDLLNRLAPVTYIFLDRRQQVVQAAIMAKAVQTERGATKETAAKATQPDLQDAARQKPLAAPEYDRELIAKWLGRIERQKLAWMRWFDRNGIVPFTVTYETLIAEPAVVVQSIVEAVGAKADQPQRIQVISAERPSDRISMQWAARFEREITSGIQPPSNYIAVATRGTRRAEELAPHPPSVPMGNAAHVLGRYLAIKGEADTSAATRLRRRHEAIIGRNRGLLKKARVLDLRCSDGCWSLAALVAGANHVTGVDSQQIPLAAARDIFFKLKIEQKSFQFDNRKIFEAVDSFRPGAFDVILCRDVSSDPHFFFRSLQRLCPKHVILDTRIQGRKEPALVVRRRQEANANPATKPQNTTLVAVPSHALIARLCRHFGFRCRVIDWKTFGIKDWTGVADYKNDRRRTYVLSRTAEPEKMRAP